MPRKYKTDRISGYTILLVDDDAEYLEATRRLLEREGHQVVTARTGPTALELLRQQPADLLLLDYYMPGMTGEQVVTQLRQFNPYLQVILQTGYASEQPPREMLQRLDIQGYNDKSEGPEKLLLWTDVGLKAAFTIQLLNKSRQGLRYILDVTPDLHRIQPLDDLLQGILLQVTGLLGAANSFLAIVPEGSALRSAYVVTESFLAILEETGLVIHASTGRFVGRQKVDDCLEPEQLLWIQESVQGGAVQLRDHSTIVPLRVGELTLGVIYLDRQVVHDNDRELLNVFANQAAVAIQNVQLYEMATLDPLTGVSTRRFFEQWLARELRTAFRSQQVLALLILDLDKMKQINDTAGHLVGDQALITLGKALRAATRSSDVIGRYGGDEFAIILPQARANGIEGVTRRILDFLKHNPVPSSNGPILLQVSIGVGMLEPQRFDPATIPHPILPGYLDAMARLLIQSADEALYRAKHAGGNRTCQAIAVQWQPLQ